MKLIETYMIICVLAMLLIPFLKVNYKGIITILIVFINAAISSFFATKALLGNSLEQTFIGNIVTGVIPIKMDALSGWFILLINFTLITGGMYGLQYMKTNKKQSSSITLHCIAYLLLQMSLIAVCIVQNAIVFLVAWEMLTLSAFLLIIFEHAKQNTLKAGVNYLIQSHISIVFLTLGFIWVASRINSFDFAAITQFSSTFSLQTGVVLFLCFFIGFAIKAGFVPFHTWLPYAHPAAPSHISGIMSGIIIKIGIYGILRIILLFNSDFVVIGYIILIFSVISGIYGVMLAIIQHDLKKLLAYHSIENIGIIGIGIGLGTIGIGTKNLLLILFGFAGSMLHVLNHSLFKSLLFYVAGNVYKATHTLNIEKLGGLIKQMPHTTVLFLVAALAICGLPPFNGFVSEFLIYMGLFNGMNSNNVITAQAFLSAIFGLVVIGGLALLCFTKAFGTVFLGNARYAFNPLPAEVNNATLLPMYLTMSLIIAIGVFPQYFFYFLSEPLKCFTNKIAVTHNTSLLFFDTFHTMEYISWCALGFFVLSGAVFFIRKRITSKHPVTFSSTWGCGYVGNTSKMQYTANSYVRTYRKLAEPLFTIKKKKKEINEIFPKQGKYETHPYDKIEKWLIDIPLNKVKYFFGQFQFLQNGNSQYYILYGIGFIVIVIGIPFLYASLKLLMEFVYQM